MTYKIVKKKKVGELNISLFTNLNLDFPEFGLCNFAYFNDIISVQTFLLVVCRLK